MTWALTRLYGWLHRLGRPYRTARRLGHPYPDRLVRVLESANMPAALVELGYLTNAEQEAALADADLQAKVAQALLDAIQRFRDSLATPVEGPVR